MLIRNKSNIRKTRDNEMKRRRLSSRERGRKVEKQTRLGRRDRKTGRHGLLGRRGTYGADTAAIYDQ
jgi:hypothetical protein